MTPEILNFTLVDSIVANKGETLKVNLKMPKEAGISQKAVIMIGGFPSVIKNSEKKIGNATDESEDFYELTVEIGEVPNGEHAVVFNDPD